MKTRRVARPQSPSGRLSPAMDPYRTKPPPPRASPCHDWRVGGVIFRRRVALGNVGVGVVSSGAVWPVAVREYKLSQTGCNAHDLNYRIGQNRFTECHPLPVPHHISGVSDSHLIH